LAKLPLIFRQRHTSFYNIAQDALYKSGGKKLIKISSQSICKEIAGFKFIINPATTRSTESASFNLLPALSALK